MQFITMICDLKSSHTLTNREEVQYNLIDMLKEANNAFSQYLASDFIITVGDEWEGLLKYPCDYNIVLDFFHQKLKDVDFYCGIGIGQVQIHNFELTVNQLDGPSFHKARTAVGLAKSMNYSLVLIQ